MPGLIEWINKKTGDKLENDKKANEFINDFVNCCEENIENKLTTNDIENKILAHAKNQEDKLTFASILDKIKPNDLKKNAFADSRVVKKLGQRIQGAKIDSAEGLKRFFNSDTIKQITKNYYTKYKKYFKFDKIVEQLRKCNFNDEITLNKAGSSVRNLLYKSKEHKLEAWLAIFGPAWKEKTANKKNIEKFLDRNLNKIEKKLSKFDFWDGQKKMDSDELKEIFKGKDLYDFISCTIGKDIELFPIILLSPRIKKELRDRLIYLINRFRDSIGGEFEGNHLKNQDILVKVTDITNKNLEDVKSELETKLKAVCSVAVNVKEVRKILKKKEEEKDINKQKSDNQNMQEMEDK